MSLLDGLQLYAPYDGNALDVSGNGRNGTTSGSPTYAAGKLGLGVDLENGSSQYVDHGNSVGIDGVSAFSWQCWYIPESLGEVNDFRPILLKGGAENTSRTVMIHGGTGAGSNAGVLCGIANGSNVYGYSGSILSIGVPVHLLMVYDGTQTGNSNRLKLYVNGVNTSLTFSGTIPATTANNPALPFRVGNINLVYGDGVFDEVAIWNRALTAVEAGLLYNNGNGLAHPFSNRVSGPAYPSSFSPVNPPLTLLHALGLA